MRQGRVSGQVEDLQRVRRAGEGVGVDQPDVELVEGVAGQGIAVIEAGRDGGREAFHKSPHLGRGLLIAGDGVGARQAGHVLPEAVARNEAVHVGGRVEARRRVVPTPEVPAGRGQPRRHPERLEQGVFVHGQQRRVLRPELRKHRPVEQRDVAITGRRQHRGAGGGGRPGRAGAAQGAGGEHAAGFQQGTTRAIGHLRLPVICLTIINTGPHAWNPSRPLQPWPDAACQTDQPSWSMSSR